MTLTSKLSLVLATLALSLTAICSSASAADADVELLGLAIGEKMPQFSLQNAEGKTVSSDSLLAEDKTLAVVFFRSAGWCRYCKQHLIALNAQLTELQAAGVTLVGISYDSVETLNAFSTKNQIKFPLLADTGSKVIDGFNVRNKEATKARSVGIPHPVIILVDANGAVSGKLGYEGYKERPPADEIIATVKAQ